MLLALGFFLVRNVVKLVVERRRALPFARFRAKLVALLLGLTLVPAVLVLAVGIAGGAHRRRSLVQRADGRGAGVGERASPPTTTRNGSASSATRPARLAQALSRVDLATDVEGVRAVDRARRHASSGSDWCRSTAWSAAAARVQSVVDVAAPDVPTGSARAGGDRLAALAVSGSTGRVGGRTGAGRRRRRAAARGRARSTRPTAGSSASCSPATSSPARWPSAPAA